MIEPVTENQIIHYQKPLRFGPASCTNFCTSTLASLNPACWLQTLFSWIKSLFCYGEKNHFSGPEINPKTIGLKDPFFQKMFVLKDGKALPRDPITYEHTKTLYEILGTGGYLSWMRHSATLYRLKSELKAINPHSLVFLYQIFQNREMTGAVANFQKNARAADWNLFMRGHIKTLSEANDLHQLISGFCKGLGIDPKAPKQLIQEKKWEAFVLHVFNERKKHFNIK